jgi:hypothetical protein
MAPLDAALQGQLREVFARLLVDARATARPRKTGPSEVDFIENFHALVAANLEDAVRRHIANSGLSLSVKVETALVHGSPFQVQPRWRHGSGPTIEIGDLMLVGERYDKESREGPTQRQALLLQMKVGKPKLRARPDGGPTRQAALFAEWPPIHWVSSAMASLPGPFPRTPNPGPCDAAQFGIVPPSSTSPFEALPLELLGRRIWFGEARDLAGELARTVRLDLGVDATPDGSNGWPRIVQDILQVAPVKTFRASAKSKAPSTFAQGHRELGASRGRFLVVRVGVADQGVLD